MVTAETIGEEQIYTVELQADLEALKADVKAQDKLVIAARQSADKDRRDKLLAARDRLRQLKEILAQKTANPGEGTAFVDIDDIEHLDAEAIDPSVPAVRKTLTVKKIVSERFTIIRTQNKKKHRHIYPPTSHTRTHTIQYNTDTIQYNTDTIQYNTDMIQYNTHG
jgi:hypothetical protein